MRPGPNAPLQLVPKEVPEGMQDYTAIALAALDEARVKILAADKAGKPCTHVVVCMVSEYLKGKTEQAMATDLVTSALVSDLAGAGVLQLCLHDYWG
jgi:hypothetical protein